jgi:uncharacterized protein
VRTMFASLHTTVFPERLVDPVGRRAESGLAVVSVLGWLSAGLSASILGIWLAFGGAAVVLGAVSLVVRGSAVRARLLVPDRRLRTRWLALGSAAGAASVLATYALYPIVIGAVPWMAAEVAALYDAFRAPSLTVAVLALVPIILGEELVWRGAVQDAVARHAGRWTGAVVTAITYGVLSAAIGSVPLVIVSLGLGLVWSMLRAWSNGLLAPLVAHVTWNAVVLLWLPLDRL